MRDSRKRSSEVLKKMMRAMKMPAPAITNTSQQHAAADLQFGRDIEHQRQDHEAHRERRHQLDEERVAQAFR